MRCMAYLSTIFLRSGCAATTANYYTQTSGGNAEARVNCWGLPDQPLPRPSGETLYPVTAQASTSQPTFSIYSSGADLLSRYMRIIIKGSMASFLFIFLIALVSATPAFADAGDEDRGIEDSRTFHVYDDVDLVSSLKFAYGKPNIIIKSVYPQLASETDRDGITIFNDLTMLIVQDEINQFRSKVKAYSFMQKSLPRSKITNSLYIDYDTSYLKSKHNHIISIRFTIQGFITGTPHPYHHHRVINYNLDTGQEIALSDLFMPDANYLAVLSDYTTTALSRYLADKRTIAEGTVAMPDNYQIWNIKPNGLLITFEETKVAPYIQGAQTVLVPYSALRQITSPDSPIADCINHKRRCTNSNLLTGGFIDEALKSRSRTTELS